MRRGANRLVVATSVALLWFSTTPAARGQDMTIASVDVFGAWTVSPQDVLAAFGVQPGDPVAFDQAAAEIRVTSLDGVEDLEISVIRSSEGVSVFVGVTEEDTPQLVLRPRPTGVVRLPEVIHEQVDGLLSQLERASRAGIFEEDASAGHAVSAYPAARLIQLSMVELATDNLESLRQVLGDSRFERERRAAAIAIGYASDKRVIVPDLIMAASDPDEEVRNYALRSLAMIAAYSNANPELRITVDPRPFVQMLDSPVWTDRNKATAVLVSLSETRDARLLQLLRDESLPALYEMALWHTGHAIPAVLILGRMAGLEDGRVIQTSYDRRDDRAAYEAWIEVLTGRASAP